MSICVHLWFKNQFRASPYYLPFPPSFAMQYSLNDMALPATSEQPPSRPSHHAPCHISSRAVSTSLVIPHYSRGKCSLPAVLPSAFTIFHFFLTSPICQIFIPSVSLQCGRCAPWRQNSPFHALIMFRLPFPHHPCVPLRSNPFTQNFRMSAPSGHSSLLIPSLLGFRHWSFSLNIPAPFHRPIPRCYP